MDAQTAYNYGYEDMMQHGKEVRVGLFADDHALADAYDDGVADALDTLTATATTTDAR